MIIEMNKHAKKKKKPAAPVAPQVQNEVDEAAEEIKIRRREVALMRNKILFDLTDILGPSPARPCKYFQKLAEEKAKADTNGELPVAGSSGTGKGNNNKQARTESESSSISENNETLASMLDRAIDEMVRCTNKDFYCKILNMEALICLLFFCCFFD